LWRIPGVAERAEGRVFPELLRLALRQKADVYIGHYPTGLCVAAHAARYWKGAYAYDIEDLHAAESPDTPEGRKRTRRIVLLEKRFIHGCAYCSAVSEGVAQEITRRYGVLSPVVVKNVFSLSEINRADGLVKDRRGNAVSLYWYSQVVGEDRGIQDLIKAAGLLKGEFQLHIRGFLSRTIHDRLNDLARTSGIEDKLYFHEPVSPEELFSRTREHDVGVASEQLVSLNRQLTISNKMFFYMLAGLALAVTRTPGQSFIMQQNPGAGFLYMPGDIQSLASGLQRFIDDREYREACKRAAFLAAQQQWNWEKESVALLDRIDRVVTSSLPRRDALR